MHLLTMSACVLFGILVVVVEEEKWNACSSDSECQSIFPSFGKMACRDNHAHLFTYDFSEGFTPGLPLDSVRKDNAWPKDGDCMLFLQVPKEASSFFLNIAIPNEDLALILMSYVRLTV